MLLWKKNPICFGLHHIEDKITKLTLEIRKYPTTFKSNNLVKSSLVISSIVWYGGSATKTFIVLKSMSKSQIFVAAYPYIFSSNKQVVKV